MGFVVTQVRATISRLTNSFPFLLYVIAVCSIAVIKSVGADSGMNVPEADASLVRGVGAVLISDTHLYPNTLERLSKCSESLEGEIGLETMLEAVPSLVAGW